jgi:hypothetical protein
MKPAGTIDRGQCRRRPPAGFYSSNANPKEGSMLPKNVGGLDRAIRIVAGVIVLALFFVYPESPWRYLAFLGLIPLVTGLLGICPLYGLLGLSTCSGSKA